MKSGDDLSVRACILLPETNMKIPFATQEANNIDWFAVDVNNFVAHFSSFGSQLPSNLPDTFEELKAASDYLLSLPFTCFEIIPNPTIEEYVEFKHRIDRKNYFEEFDGIAMRGLFAFDKTDPMDEENFLYHQVASPGLPLNLNDLPSVIRDMLKKMKLDIDFGKAYSINIKEYLQPK